MKLSVRASVALAAAAAAVVGAQGLAMASPTGTAGTLSYTHTIDPTSTTTAVNCPSGTTVFTLTGTTTSSTLRAAAPLTTLVQLQPASTLNYAAKVAPAHNVAKMVNNITLVGFDANNKAVQCGQLTSVAAPTISGQDAAAQVAFSGMPANVARWQATVNGVITNTNNTFYRFNETTDSE